MITLDPTDSTPPYEQIRLAVLHDIASGELHPGDRLPTVRKLAADLAVAPNTVARAYRELEQDRVVETARRNGTRVSLSTERRQHDAVAAAGQYADQLLRLGLTVEDGVRLLRQAHQHTTK